MLPAHAREAVVLALNMSYMYFSEEFEKALNEFGPLHSNNNNTPIDKSKLIQKCLKHSGLCFGHYANDTNETHTVFHEFGHCLGYGHDGNMTDEMTGPGWISLCADVYRSMYLKKELPVYSRRFMHTRLNINRYNQNNLHVTSKYII